MPFEFDIPVRFILLPVVGAFIGYLTNLLAVRMLFRPRKAIGFGPFKIQGVFPKRQKVFAEKIGGLVSEELLETSDVLEQFYSLAEQPEVIEDVKKQLREIIARRVPEVLPAAAMFMTPELLDQLANSFEEDIKKFLKEMISSLGGNIEESFQVRQLVEEKVANFSSAKLEEIILRVMKRELRFVEFIGAVLGFLIGLGQLVLLSLEGPF